MNPNLLTMSSGKTIVAAKEVAEDRAVQGKEYKRSPILLMNFVSAISLLVWPSIKLVAIQNLKAGKFTKLFTACHYLDSYKTLYMPKKSLPNTNHPRAIYSSSAVRRFPTIWNRPNILYDFTMARPHKLYCFRCSNPCSARVSSWSKPINRDRNAASKPSSTETLTL